MKNFWLTIPIGTILITIALAAGWFYLWFLVSDTLDRVIAAETEAASLSRRQNNISQLKTVLAETADQRRVVAGLFITPEQIVPLIESLEREAGRLGASLAINQAETGQEHLTLALTATGSFGALSQLLVFVENLPYLTRLESVTLGQGAPGEDSAGQWTLRLVILIASFDNL